MKRNISLLNTFNKFISTTALLTLLILLLFAILRWLDLDAGSFVDWMIGIVTFWWLLIVVIVPWNIYFQTKAILHKAKLPADERITIKPEHITYAQTWERRALFISIGLHIFSAIGLYFVAQNVSSVGYIGAVLALLLTALRPVVSGYEYLTAQFSNIDQRSRFPYDNVYQMQDELRQFKKQVAYLESQFDAKNENSWTRQHQQNSEAMRERLDKLSIAVNELRVSNQADHDRLTREAQNVVAQLSEDGQFLNHVREIIRFVKTT